MEYTVPPDCLFGVPGLDSYPKCWVVVFVSLAPAILTGECNFLLARKSRCLPEC